MVSAIDQIYEIVSVEPTDPPSDAEGAGWHRYVIGLGKTRIRGYQRGDLEAVTLSVEQIVARLNERRLGKRGRVHLDMSSQKSKPKSN